MIGAFPRSKPYDSSNAQCEYNGKRFSFYIWFVIMPYPTWLDIVHVVGWRFQVRKPCALLRG
jgi:hypothetical protein